MAFAGAWWQHFAMARRHQYSDFSAAVLVGMVALDAKSIDFATNGMETGFLLLFIAIHVVGDVRRRTPALAALWDWPGGGLMWTRPDGFIYIGLLVRGRVFLQ